MDSDASTPNQDSAANQFVIMEMLKDLLAFSEDPGHMGAYLTQQIREFLGARIVVLVHYQKALKEPSLRIVSIQPERFQKWDQWETLQELFRAGRNIKSTTLFNAEGPSCEINQILKRLKVGAAIAAPLMVGDEFVGCLFAIDLLDSIRQADTAQTLTMLSPVVALVLRNSNYYESLETEIQERTQELRQSERQYRELAQPVPVGIFRLNERTHHLYANAQWYALTGLHGFAGEQINFEEYIHPEDRERASEAFSHAVKTKKSVEIEFRIIRPDGQCLWVMSKIQPELNESTNITGIIGTLMDINNRKCAEDALLETEQQLLVTQELGHTGSWVYKPGSDKIWGSAESLRIFGFPPITAEIPLDNLESCIPERQRVHQALVSLVEEGQKYNIEYQIDPADGSPPKIVSSIAMIEKDVQGNQIKIQGFIQDITKRKKDEEDKLNLQVRLQDAHKLESLGVLSAGVAHNINNVLAVIMGTASLHEQTATESSDREAYQTISKACTRGRDVVKSMLHFAQPNLSIKTPVELHTLIQEVRVLLENTTRNSISISETLAGESLWIYGDSGSINHAILNLCLNSLGAMPNGGTLTFRTRVLEGNHVEVSVEDNGTGMTPEILAHVLEPFYTTKEVGKGTGLGLSMTYGVVKAHGGSIDIASQPGQGTCVKLRFPRISAPVESELETVGATFPSLASMKVFLVDDDEDVRFLMNRMLKKAGVRQVKVFPGGKEVLESLGSEELPNLIILDQNMPSMTGVQTMARIRGLHPEMPILISSGQPDIAAWDDFKEHKVGVISKPFTLEEIQAKLAQFSGESFHSNDGMGGS